MNDAAIIIVFAFGVFCGLCLGIVIGQRRAYRAVGRDAGEVLRDLQRYKRLRGRQHR
jgi:ABC-type nitrate/sulfonate/bicarbonate transport system permease component